MKPDFDHNEQELQLLYRGIKRAQGFHLYLAQCDNPQLREKIQASLKKQLEADRIMVFYHHLKSAIVSLDELLPAGLAVPKNKKAVLLVSGLENSIIDTVESQDFLHRLNYARDLLPKKIPIPLVLWLPAVAFKKILTEAHDLWSWRSGTFYFSESLETEQFQLRGVMDKLGEKEKPGTISEKSYKEQLAYLTNTLENLTSRDNSETARLQQADVLQQISDLNFSHADTLRQPDQRKRILEKALEYQIKALGIKELLMGEFHPDVAKSYANLSSIYFDMMQLDRALEFQLKALTIWEAILDKNHPDLAMSYNNLSLIYQDMGQLDRALEFQLKAIEINEAVLDKNNPDLATSYNNLSLIYQDMGQLDQALEFQLKAIEINEAVLDKNNPDLATSYNNISMIYKDMGHLDQALESQLKDIAISEKILDKKHPNLATSYNNISLIYQDMGQLDRALEFQLKALAIQEAALDKNYPNLAASYNNLSTIYQAMGQLDRALEFQLKALAIQGAALDKNYPNLAASYNNVSLIYQGIGQLDQALEFQLKAISIMQHLFPNGHPNLDKSKRNLEILKNKMSEKENKKGKGNKK